MMDCARRNVAMTTRRAACNCGKLEIICESEPVRITICHCLECQHWSRFQQPSMVQPPANYLYLWWLNRIHARSDAGRWVRFQFCPKCGSTVYWEAEAFPGHIAVAVGSFADPSFPQATVFGWEQRRHPWVEPLQSRS